MVQTRPFCISQIHYNRNFNHHHHRSESIWSLIFDFFTLFNHNNSQKKPRIDDDYYYEDNDNGSINSSSSKSIGLSCSEETIFVWIPIIILLISFIIEYFWLRCRQKSFSGAQMKYLRSPPLALTIFYIFKIIAATSLYIISLSRIIYWYLYADNNPLGLLDPWVPVMADSIRAISWLLIIALYITNRSYQNLSSGSIFVFLIIKVIIHLYSTIVLIMELFDDDHEDYQPKLELAWVTNHPMMIGSRMVYSFGIFFLFFLECLSDDDAVKNRNNGRKTLRDKLTSPEQSASFFNRLTFSWFNSLVLKTWHKGFVGQEDLWLLSGENSSQSVLQSFKKVWNDKRDQGSEAKIMSILFQIYSGHLVWIALLKLVSSLFIFVNPIVLDWILAFLNPSSKEPYWKGFLYASLMFVSPMLESIFSNQHEYHLNIVTMKMKTCISSIIYNKSLRLSNTSKQQFSTGEIVNLISVDVLRIIDLMNNINTLWWAPLQITVGIYLLWLQLSYASIAGLSCMLLIVPVNIAFTNKLRFLQLYLMTKKDSRSKLMNEILNGIKVIKLNAWEKHFENKIYKFREWEVKKLKTIAYCMAFMTTFNSSGAVLVALSSFVAFTLISSDNILDANRAFVSLSLTNIIRVPLTFLPVVFSLAGIAWVSIERINYFLNLPEITDYIENNDSIQNNSEKRPDNNNDNVAISIENGYFNWNENDPVPTLSSVDLEIPKRKLVAIVGGVGCGKSSLLSAILGEMQKLNGKVKINGKIAYVPQEAWILNATIKENILLNKKYDEKKYRKVLEACSLHVDMAMFPAGDMTEVGEKGINLSGGQKQRISMARAIYSNSDIYLLDNPLSALDVHVGQHIFNQVIGKSGCLRNKTRLLVTTKISLLPHVEEIIYISRGEIKDRGTFSDLIDNRGPFSEYVAEYFIDQQSGFETDLDETDTEFITSMESKIKKSIEKVQLVRSTSLNRNISMTETRYHSTFVSQTFTRSFNKTISIVESGEIFPDNINITQGRLIQAEEMATGAVDTANHRIYFKTMGLGLIISALLALLLSNVFQVLGSLWLSDWSNDSLRPIEQIDSSWRTRRMVVFGVLGMIEIIFTFAGTLQLCLGCVRASKILHNQMMSRIIRAPMSFFDTTPMGRILNRFTRDIDVIDLRISTNLRLFIMQIFRIIVAFGLIGMEAPLILIFLLPLTTCYYMLQKLFINSSRQLKRIEAVTRSPMNNHLSETVNGTTSIRAYGLNRKFIREMMKRIDDNNQSYWLGFVATRWLGVRLEFISYSIVFLATLFAVMARGSLSPGIAGLAISYSLNITAILSLLIRGYSENETNFVSVERVAEYMEVPKEKQLIQPELARIPIEWPSKGEINFENYSTQYRPGLKLCLKRVTLTITGGSKVAIVGRTGSGKSSLSLALFRILEPVEGTIHIDDIDIRKITLEKLRKSLTIVPQEPVVFSTTIKENVDTLNEFTDEEIVRALTTANLEQFLETINYDINYNLNAGENLSSGQKQLICLARALLKRSAIIVFDEATASVDYETDSHIHNTIFSEEFKSKTVLMIAHRLDRIMDYDYILVMDNGEMSEFDSPKRLVTNPDGQFYALAKEAKLI